MHELIALLLLSCALGLGGCSGGGAVTCQFGGKAYHPGDTFPSPDGCNTCSCTAEGAVACTARACAGDGGPPPGDAGMDVVMCWGATRSFPTFDKHCNGPADCAFGLHQVDCCGSRHAIGFNQAEGARFHADEAICEGMYPGCGCAEAPTLAEDGKTSITGTDIAVDCKMGACQTYIK